MNTISVLYPLSTEREKERKVTFCLFTSLTEMRGAFLNFPYILFILNQAANPNNLFSVIKTFSEHAILVMLCILVMQNGYNYIFKLYKYLER